MTAPTDEAARLARQHSKVALAQEQLRLRAEVARLEAELARLRILAPGVDLTTPPLLRVEVPVLITSPLNGSQGGYHRKARTRSRLRDLVTLCLRTTTHRTTGAHLLTEHPRLSVHLERRAAGELDLDNLAAGAKSAVDAVAEWLGCDDGPRGPLRISYSQQAHRRWQNAPLLVVELRGAP